jgi:hypothetical protein
LLDIDVVLCALMGHDFAENSAVLSCHRPTPTECALQLAWIVRTFHGNPAVAVLLAQPSKKFVVHGELWQSWKCSESELFAVGAQMSIDVLQRQRRFEVVSNITKVVHKVKLELIPQRPGIVELPSDQDDGKQRT